MAESYVPLAARMRPKNFAEFVGQEHIIGKGKALRELIEHDQLSSLILWGPPGCGKTSLAKVIASVTKSHFEYLSAVESATEDLKRIISEAQHRLHPLNSSLPTPHLNLKLGKTSQTPQRTILTVDEIHRWNRAQQAALLPYVENGTVVLIGCTTENPYFEVIGPLLSRSAVYQLKALTENEIVKILKRGLKIVRHIKISEKLLRLIAQYSNGDARRALNILESAVNLKANQKKEELATLTKEIIEDVIQRRIILYDKDRDAHYDTISFFIKSMRGSDPDAALFYLVKMLEAGEDPKFIARRIVILASEDIGNADPNALNIATSAFEAVEKVGLPEAELNLAQATIYMACAPKSNAVYKALTKAKRDLKEKGIGEIPLHLRNAPHPGLEKHHYGENYQYPHLYEEGYVPEEHYLPKHLIGTRYYEPTCRGYEKIIKARLKFWRSLKKQNQQKKKGPLIK